jgi:hypothetical protein
MASQKVATLTRQDIIKTARPKYYAVIRSVFPVGRQLRLSSNRTNRPNSLKRLGLLKSSTD